MVELEFSVMENNPGDIVQLRPLLKIFEEQYRIRVNPVGITWAQGWTEIAKFGIYRNGPDVSAIGTTWVGSLAGMQALHSFTDPQIRALGGADAFFEPSWQAGLMRGDPRLWAVPWIGDVMLLYFWEKTLVKAGITNFQEAFATDDALVKTLDTLQKSGLDYPLAINVNSNSIILHEAAHWVWNAGGDFISPDGKSVAFDQPAALRGLHNYFSLKPYISPELLTTAYTGSLFNTSQAAVHFAGPWLNSAAQNSDWGNDKPNVLALPGTTFTGGLSFVLWQYSLHPQEAFELIRFLATQPVQAPTSVYHDQVPTRCDALNVPLNQNDVFHRGYAQYLKSIQKGRSFPTIRLWGAVEDKLRVGLSNIWADLFDNPTQDLDACIVKHLGPLARRLNMTLGS
jgi:ABC-type glycerol-3-phosphate transport system substrate-binding protein